MPITLAIPADKVFSWFWPEPGRPERRTLQNLQDDWDMLNAARDHTNTKIQETRNMRTLPEVTLWLQQVESLGLRVETLITDYTRESVNQCFYGCFPKNCKKRIDLWKQISPMDHEVLHLLSQKKEVVAETPLVPSAQRVPTDSTTPYIQKMLDQIWIQIQDEKDVGLIGLYGMGGVGKTTLLKAIHNKLCSSTQLFDLHLGMIVVSKTPNLDAIQNHVGEKIGFHGDDWMIKSQDEKAQDIFNVLHEKKYILLLDDIWERFDLTKIGISHDCLKTKSKVIFTTRNEQVCGQMQGRKIQVKCLQTKEAWDLFQEKVGEESLNNKAHPDILELAKDVARECGGLPLAVIVVGRAMSCKKTKHEWEHAIRKLKKGNVGQSSTMMDEYLNLLGTNIQEIPVELKKLVKLKYLNLEFTQISEIPEGILLSLKQLSVFGWIHKGVSAQSRDFLSEKLVKELEGISYLQDLTTAAHSNVDISHLTSSVKLLSCITQLTLARFNGSNSLNILFLREMKQLCDLFIFDLEKVEKIMVEDEGFEISAMNFRNVVNTSLQYLSIVRCRYLKNLSWLVFFPNIKLLNVEECPEMQILVSANEYNLENELQPFAKLVTLSLRDLPKLENIYATPLLFPLLRRLEVRSGCNRLKKLPLNSSSTCESGEMNIIGHQQWWDELQWEDEATRITFSRRFLALEA